MNKKLLLKVKKMILKEPKRLNMSFGIVTTDELPNTARDKCGTAGCIAGWAVLLDEREKTHKTYKKLAETNQGWYYTRINAERLLKLNAIQANKLFFVRNWPTDTLNVYSEMKSYGSHGDVAKVVAKRIDKFIESKGME